MNLLKINEMIIFNMRSTITNAKKDVFYFRAFRIAIQIRFLDKEWDILDACSNHLSRDY